MYSQTTAKEAKGSNYNLKGTTIVFAVVMVMAILMILVGSIS